MNIVLIGGYGLGNYGDDLLLSSAVQSAKALYPLARISVHCSSPEAQLSDSYRTATLWDLLSADRLLYGGGTLFYDFSTLHGRRARVLSRRERWQRRCQPPWWYWRLKQALIDHYLHQRCSVVFLGSGFGPLKATGRAKGKLDQLSRRGRVFFGLRDQRSVAYLAEGTPAQLGTDLAFQHVPSAFEASAPAPSRPRIAIVVRDWVPDPKAQAQLQVTLLALAKRWRAQGRRVQFVIFSQRRDQRWQQALKAAQESVLCWEAEDQRLEAFTAKLAEFDLIISARFHGLVAAALAAQPSIGIELEPKIRLAGQSTGCLCWNPNTQSADTLEQQLNELLENWAAHRQRVKDTAEQQHRVYQQMISAVSDFEKSLATD